MARLLFYRDPETAWQILLPWFRYWPREAWRQERPIVFLAPDSSVIAWVKSRLVQARIPVLGIQFHAPGGLRALLRTNAEARPLALREDLRLLMELAAGDLPDNPVAQATAQEPSDFLKHCDRLEAAGWDANAFDLPEARELAQRFYELVAQSGLQTSASADRALLDGLKSPPLAQVMAYGFGPGQGNSLTLLRALPELAQSVVYCLPISGDQPDELVWRSTLELLGEAVELPQSVDHPLANLSLAAEFHETLPAAEPQLKVVLTPDIAIEACVIENEIHRWRTELSPGERIGVVFARDGLPLAREVARRLADCGLAHQDEIGHQPGRRTPQLLVEAWQQYQERADADSARAFVRTLCRAGLISTEAEYAVRRGLEYAFNEAMTTSLAVLWPLVKRQKRGELAGGVLDTWPLLPERGTFAEFTALCLPVLKKLRWPERLDAWEQRAATLAENLTRPLKRGHYLRWLAEVCRIPGRTRPQLGREAFAPVVLTTVERAVAQSWQYLIFAGLNRGDWPSEHNDSLLLDTRQSGRLNQRATMDSPVGLGQKCLRPSKSWLANSLDERRRFADAGASLLRNVQIDALFTAHRENPAEPGREQDLADWLNRLIHAQFGRLPGDDDLRTASALTANTFAPEPVEGGGFPEISLAWNHRRDPRTAFDEYSYCFAEPPDEPLALSCKAWEDALRLPAHAWQQYVLGVRPEKELQEQEPRSLAIGNWAHAWVQPLRGDVKDDFLPCPSREDWAALVERQAQQVRQRMTEAYANASRALPDWWRIDWALARRWAHQFAESLAALGWPAVRGEWTLPRQPLHLPGNPLDGLTFSGRIDALLSDAPPEELNRRGGGWPDVAAVWIIDFKTGGDKPLTTKQLLKGEGIQLALYALALHSLGAERVQTSLLRPGETVDPQVSLEQILSLDEPWENIRCMATTGRFGMRGAQRSDYGFVGNYPLAHLPIKAAVLEAKWQLTHPTAE